ncbi:hypothetical protein KOR42_14650 [Thalassoglobus neptunius]|uniref:Prenyltransferase and squalene oxidase repeat protein n=1 Tax=Thalassoglobus neptunius TaxID=1938619 RepID=A0A5C5X591_9PLAN|nr:prenyltransferase/squalene oxidase repeat-containing protein [Thalassoglobus neptunius]TWT58094.1 hypothetical protein KOR42_14650 [Thalassoglobus neptunius]
MIFLTPNYRDEIWHLGMLLISIVQPVLVVLMAIGFIFVTAHLITMIGTRWGDRRTNSKALFFSLAIHLLLACGLIALIPEYRPHISTNPSNYESEPIRVRPPQEKSDLLASNAGPGNTPVWDQLKNQHTENWERFSAPSIELEDSTQELLRTTEESEFTPSFAGDAQPLPLENQPVPQQEIDAEQGVLEEAAIDLQTEKLVVNSTPSEEAYSEVRDRLNRETASVTGETEDLEAARPRAGSIDRLRPELARDRQKMNLLATSEPGIPEVETGQADSIRQIQAPVAIALDPESAGVMRDPEETSASPRSASGSGLTRTRPRQELISDDVTISRYRPSATPSRPDSFSPDPSASLSGMNQLARAPEQPPQLRLPSGNLPERSEQRTVPSAYVLRSEDLRERAVLKYGGSDESESAVDRSLKWLAQMQHPDGYWDASRSGAGQVGVDDEGIDRQYAGRYADTGVTALAVLAFLGKLNTVDEGEYSDVVNRALRWLIAQQRPRRWSNGEETIGYLGGEATQFAGMYCHGMATFALAEAYAISKNDSTSRFLRQPLEDAVSYILETQINDGGWRYIKGQPDGDMSMFGWQLMALKSAEAAGIEIPQQAKEQMRKFLRDRRLGRYGGLAGYRSSDPPSPAMTAEAMFCRHVLNVDNDRSAANEASRYLLANRPSRSTINLYYWYYGTLAMYQHGGDDWDQWNNALRDLLIAEQRKTGPQAGSWDPRGVWGRYGGRIYSTAIATLSLEVYYRYLREE